MRISAMALIVSATLAGCTKDTPVTADCEEGSTRCSGDMIQRCESGVWADWDDCSVQEGGCTTVKGEAVCVGSGDTGADGDADGDTDGDGDGDGDVDGDGDADTDADGDGDTDADGDGDADGDAGMDLDTDERLSLCDPERTCAGLKQAEDCVASFELGTTQGGFTGLEAAGWPSDYPFVGFYAYNDYSESGIMFPERNGTEPGPAEAIRSCGTDGYAMHVVGNDLWVDWGVGLDLFWGGPPNPACEVDGALECLEAFMEDDRLRLEQIQALPECDTEEKVTCATRGEFLKEPRDLSGYRGLGFWLLAQPDNDASVIDVQFPIPATTRFESDPEEDCNNDDASSENDCFNDFTANISLSPVDVGRWVYKEVLFEDLAQNPHWGFRLPEGTPFPPEQSIGLSFMFGNVVNSEAFDFYIDDIILLQ